MSRQLWEGAETKISAGPSRVTGPAELNEMVQYVVPVPVTVTVVISIFTVRPMFQVVLQSAL
jgi:hypothetical protein